MRVPRFIHHIYAVSMGYFWLPCPVCNKMFGGHEWLPGNNLMYSLSGGKGVCPNCGDFARKQNAEDETIKVVEIWLQVERQLLNPNSRAFTHAKRRGAIQAYENVLELLKTHDRHLTTKTQ